MPVGPIEELLTSDHARLSALLDRADAGTDLDRTAYDELRRGLLRHIALEEKVLLPAVREATGAAHPLARDLRVEHGHIAKLLVPPPSRALCDELRQVLVRHNALEEGEGALYATCDRLLVKDLPGVLRRLREYPEVPAAPYYDGPLLRR